MARNPKRDVVLVNGAKYRGKLAYCWQRCTAVELVTSMTAIPNLEKGVPRELLSLTIATTFSLSGLHLTSTS